MDTEEKIISPSSIKPDELFKFLDELRQAGYKIGTEQYIAVQDVLIALASQGRLPDTFQDLYQLRTWIAPIICTSPEEQNTFYERFDHWLNQSLSSAQKTFPPDNEPQTVTRGLKLWGWIVAGMVVLLAVVVFTLYSPSQLPVDQPPPFPTISVDGWIMPGIIVILALLLVSEFWGPWQILSRLWSILRGQVILKKRSSSEIPQFAHISVRNKKEAIFQESNFRKISQKLGQRREIEINELDIPATVAITSQKAGWFTPVYGSRKLVPEYLVLVDRTSFQDQQACRADEIIAQLTQNGILVKRYYFNKDPRYCWNEDPKTPHLTLQDLKAHYPDHRLLIFSESINLISPLTGRPYPWLEDFALWSERAILTPASPINWGYQEQVISDSGFLVVPATTMGLTLLIEKVHSENVPEVGVTMWWPDYPELLKEQPTLWLERDEPDPEIIYKLCSQLKYFLGSTAYYWLSACAVYPMLHWGITLYLGSHLKGDHNQEVLNEARLLALTRLPWFRYGKMPEWLRLKLISDLSETQERTIRQVLEKLLLSALEQSQEGFVLEIAQKPEDQKRLVRSFLDTEPEDSQLRDYVFLEFMSGRKPSKLVVTLPDAIRSLFFHDPQSRNLFLRRPVPLLLFIITVFTTLWGGTIMEVGHPSFSLWKGLPFAFTILLILAAHALGHYITARMEGIQADPPYFVPNFSLSGISGAYTKMQWPILKRKALLKIFTIGPISGFCVSWLMIIIGLYMSKTIAISTNEGGISLGRSLIFFITSRLIIGHLPDSYDILLHPVAFAGWLGIIYNCNHLLPIGKMDGGRIVYALWGYRTARKVSFISIGVLIALGIFSWTGWISMAIFGIICMVGFREQYASDNYTDSLEKSTLYLIGAALIIFILTFTPKPFTLNF